MKPQGGFWSRPWNDYLRLLQLLSKEFNITNVLMLIVGVGVGWWIYVPIHELFHAWGCQLSGGSVGRLEISPEYGAAWLQQYFPYVAVGSDYAGQLVEFDTFGSDRIYAVTVLAPFILTVYPGIPLYYWLIDRPWSSGTQFFCLGLLIPVVIAPFVSILGDYYEIGSIIVSNIAAWLYPTMNAMAWRGDDFLLVASTIGPAAPTSDWVGVSLGLLVGIILAWSTYALGVFFRPRPKGHSFAYN
ncbi:MAG: hypothetical protein Tsb002_25880 [Wenzhouxiangellaceae bacterium]